MSCYAKPEKTSAAEKEKWGNEWRPAPLFVEASRPVEPLILQVRFLETNWWQIHLLWPQRLFLSFASCALQRLCWRNRWRPFVLLSANDVAHSGWPCSRITSPTRGQIQFLWLTSCPTVCQILFLSFLHFLCLLLPASPTWPEIFSFWRPQNGRVKGATKLFWNALKPNRESQIEKAIRDCFYWSYDDCDIASCSKSDHLNWITGNPKPT